MKKKLFIIMLIVTMGSLLCFSDTSGSEINISKIGEWGTGIYRDVFVKNSYAYIAAGGNGLDIVDINNPSNPTIIGNQNLDSETKAVYVSGNYAFVACINGLHIVDVTVPTAPRVLGFYAITAYTDSFHGISPTATGVTVEGNYAFLAIIFGKYNSLTIDIIDVTDPTKPKATGASIQSGEDYSFYRLPLQKNGNYLFFHNSLENAMEIVDISTPTSPKRKNPIYSVTHFAVGGNNAYVFYNNELKILDIQDPENPQEIGNTTVDGQVVEMVAAGNYLYMIYELSQTESEIHIFDVSDPSAPRPSGDISFSSTSSALFVSGDHQSAIP